MKHTVLIKSTLGGFLMLLSIVGCNSKNKSESHSKTLFGGNTGTSFVGHAGRAVESSVENTIRFFAKELNDLQANFDAMVEIGIAEDKAEGVLKKMTEIYETLARPSDQELKKLAPTLDEENKAEENQDENHRKELLKKYGKKVIGRVKGVLFNTEVLNKHQELTIRNFLDVLNKDFIRAMMLRNAFIREERF